MLHRAHRRRRYERASSLNYSEENDAKREAITPPTTPETPKLEGFHFCASNKRLSSSLNETRKGKPPTRQLSMPAKLDKKEDNTNETVKDTNQDGELNTSAKNDINNSTIKCG